MSMSSTELIRVGVIGIGNMGRSHAQNILNGNIPGLRLTAVSDSDPKRLEDFCTVSRFANWRTMIASKEIDAVIISTPHFSHVPIGIAALNAGLHVLMEKPLAVQKADCETILSRSLLPGQVFALMFNQRGDPAYRKIKEMLGSGELGTVQRIQWTVTDWYRPDAYYASSAWRATWAGEGGGVLVNQCPHNLDLYQWLFGMPTQVRGFCSLGRYHKIEVEDEVTAWFRHPNGASGVFVTSTGEAPGVNRLEVAADRGRLVLENRALVFNRNEVLASEFSRTAKGPFTQPAVIRIDIPLPSGTGEQHVGILKNFSAAIREGAPLIAPSHEGVHSVELANAILMSSLLNETIDLPFASPRYNSLLESLIAKSGRSTIAVTD